MKPASPSSRASWPANFKPAPEALREPTIAIIGRIERCVVTAHGEQRRRIVERRQPRRIAVLAGREPGDAELAARGELGLRLVHAADAPRSRRAAAARQIRQPLQRGTRRAEVIDQRTEGARPDIVGADQPQAVDPVSLGQLYARIDGVHGVSLWAQHGTT